MEQVHGPGVVKIIVEIVVVTEIAVRVETVATENQVEASGAGTYGHLQKLTDKNSDSPEVNQ